MTIGLSDIGRISALLWARKLSPPPFCNLPCKRKLVHKGYIFITMSPLISFNPFRRLQYQPTLMNFPIRYSSKELCKRLLYFLRVKTLRILGSTLMNLPIRYSSKRVMSTTAYFLRVKTLRILGSHNKGSKGYCKPIQSFLRRSIAFARNLNFTRLPCGPKDPGTS